MNKDLKDVKNISKISEKAPITSPIFQEKLVSKVNALTFNNCNNSINNPQNIMFNNDKGFTLDYKSVIDELIKITDISSIAGLFSQIYSIIRQNIESNFIAFGLFKEKSNCINLNLQDKLGNVYSSKVFLKDSDNPIVQAFNNRNVIFKNDVDFLKLSYFKNHKVAILPLISVNKCIGVIIFEDNYANQNIALYKLIAAYAALFVHNFELIEKSDE